MGHMDVPNKTCDYPKQRGDEQVKCGRSVPDGVPTVVVHQAIRYEMDLCVEHQERLTDALWPFLSTAAVKHIWKGKVLRKAIQDKHGKGAFTTADVRKWANEEGIPVSSTGRVHESLIEKFRQAQGL